MLQFHSSSSESWLALNLRQFYLLTILFQDAKVVCILCLCPTVPVITVPDLTIKMEETDWGREQFIGLRDCQENKEG